MTDPTGRKSFEAWWGHSPDRRGDGYIAYNIHDRWEAWRDAWQAAIKAEREAAAKVCEDYGASYDNEWNRKLGVANDLKDACEECAAAIRARSN